MKSTHYSTVRLIIVGLFLIGNSLAIDVIAKEYALLEAVKQAQANDPWLEGSQFRQENLEALSVHAGTLPDPSVSVGMANVPMDSFDFAQEGMTQFKVGVSQTFPRGQSRALRQERLEELSQREPFAREDRKASTAVTVSHLWLEVFRSQKTIALIEHDRSLFEYLVDVAQSSYSTASGRTRQQDLIRAQLELTRLEDRLVMLQQHREAQLARLGEWLSDYDDLSITMADALPLVIEMQNLVSVSGRESRQRLVEVLMSHPKVASINQKVSAGEASVKLAKQSYKPQWGVNASYGMRDADSMGNDRSDFFSVGVSFDVPLFTGKRQDKQVQAAMARKEGIKTERALTLRSLRSGFESAAAGYRRLIERKVLFDTRLIKEMSEQAEASLTAYTNDDGGFSEVVRARIAELNARIDALNIDVDIQKMIAQLNYFLTAKSTPSDLNVITQPRKRAAISGEAHE